jgi:hypothetical protein
MQAVEEYFASLWFSTLNRHTRIQLRGLQVVFQAEAKCEKQAKARVRKTYELRLMRQGQIPGRKLYGRHILYATA